MEMVAKKGYTYTAIPFFDMSVVEKNYSTFRKCWLEAGRDADSNSLGLLLPIYVSQTDNKARKEYEEHFWYSAQRLLNGVQICPPGYSSVRSMMRMAQTQSSFLTSVTNWDEVIKGSYAIVGRPATATEKLLKHISELGAGHFMGLFQIGALPHELTTSNMEIFAQEVLPALKKEFPQGPKRYRNYK